VIHCDSGPASIAITRATSVVSVRRPLGLRAAACCVIPSPPGIFRTAGVSVTPARIALTVTSGAGRASTAQLADVGLERRFRGRNGAVARPHPRGSGARHREHAAAAHQEPARECVLDPIHEAMGHHLQRHRHLGRRGETRAVAADERAQTAERERMEQHADRAPAVVVDACGEWRFEHLASLLVVGGVDVEESASRPAARIAAVISSTWTIPARPIEVDAADCEAALGQLSRRRFAEAARGAENQRQRRSIFSAIELRTIREHGERGNSAICCVRHCRTVGSARMAEDRRDGAPAVEHRWWVDTGKTKERARPGAGRASARRPAGFSTSGTSSIQERARTRLTDINLKFLQEAQPSTGRVDDGAHGPVGAACRRRSSNA